MQSAEVCKSVDFVCELQQLLDAVQQDSRYSKGLLLLPWDPAWLGVTAESSDELKDHVHAAFQECSNNCDAAAFKALVVHHCKLLGCNVPAEAYPQAQLNAIEKLRNDWMSMQV